MSKQSSQAYDSIIFGRVQNVRYHHTDSEFSVLKPEILPCQRQGRKTPKYELLVIADNRENCLRVLTLNARDPVGIL